MPPPIGISAALPPVSAARPSPPETDLKAAAARPRAAETQPAAPPARLPPVETAERLAPAKPEDTARLTIDYDKDAGRYIYRLVDPATREVLRELPSEDALRRIRAVRQAAGITVDQRT